MNARENFIRMVRREGPAYLPLEVPTTPPVAERICSRSGAASVELALDTDMRGVEPRWPDRQEIWAAAYRERGIELPRQYVICENGIMWEKGDPESLGEAWHLMRMHNPLKGINTVEELESLPWLDRTAPEPYAQLAGRVAEIHAAEKIAVGYREMTVFEAAWYLRSMDELFMDWVDENPVGMWLMDRCMNDSIAAVRAYCRAGCDVIRLGDDIGTQIGMMMSMDQWRCFIKPRLAKVIAAIREERGRDVFIFYHSDGDIREAIPELIELGIDILNPVQPECMPVDELVAQYKDQITFWGMIGTQTTMPFGTPDEVVQAVERIAEYARNGASVIVAPTHVLEPDVSLENIDALVATTRGISL